MSPWGTGNVLINCTCAAPGQVTSVKLPKAYLSVSHSKPLHSKKW